MAFAQQSHGNMLYAPVMRAEGRASVSANARTVSEHEFIRSRSNAGGNGVLPASALEKPQAARASAKRRDGITIPRLVTKKLQRGSFKKRRHVVPGSMTDGPDQDLPSVLRERDPEDLSDELNLMSQLASDFRTRTICESGFDFGHSSLQWLRHSSPQTHVYSFGVSSRPDSERAADWLQAQFSGRFTMTWGDTSTTLPEFSRQQPSVKCNLILVGGARSHDATKTDLLNFAPMADLGYNQVLVNNVYCNQPYCRGTTMAWMEMVSNGTIRAVSNTVANNGSRGFAVGIYRKTPSRSALTVKAGAKQTLESAMHKQEFLNNLDEIASGRGGSDKSFPGWNPTDIPGDQLELNQLAMDARVHTICETGFDTGRSAARWLMLSKASKVYSFDTGSRPYSLPAAGWLENLFPGRLSVIWGNSTETIPLFAKQNPEVLCNVVFVNSGSTLPEARDELRNLASMVDPSFNKIVFTDQMPATALQPLVSNGTVDIDQHVTDLEGHWGFSIGRYVVSSGGSALTAVNLTRRQMYQKLHDIAIEYGGLARAHESVPEERTIMNALVADPHVQKICETGFSLGHSALRWLLQSRSQPRVYSFGDGAHKYSRSAASWLQTQFLDRLTVTWGNSTQTVPEFARKRPDVRCNLIFVDGGNEPSVVKANLRNLALMSNSSYNRVVVTGVFCTNRQLCARPTNAWKELVADGIVVQDERISIAGGKHGMAVGHYSGSPSVVSTGLLGMLSPSHALEGMEKQFTASVEKLRALWNNTLTDTELD